MYNTISMTVNQASESKAAFLEWLNHIDISECSPWAIDWVKTFFTDEMAQAFPKFYNGSYDDQQIVLESGEVLPSLIDDIEECMSAFAH